MIYFDALTREDCEKIRLERNRTKGILRTNIFLTQDMQEKFYDEIINNRNSNSVYLAVREEYNTKSIDGELIGTTYNFLAMVGLTNISINNRNAEISMFVRNRYASKGLGNNILNKLLKYGLYNMNLDNIYGECYECNENINFWKKNIEKYNGYSTILPKRKFLNGVYYYSLYFNFSKDYISIELLDSLFENKEIKLDKKV